MYVNPTIYYKNQADIITYLLQNASTLVACFPEEPEQIKGYVIYEYLCKTLIMHYAYFKTMHRNQHLFTDIVTTLCDPDNTIIVCTHINFNFPKLQHVIEGKRLTYDPYFITTKRLLGAP
jgi:hypothetical protein